MLRIIPGAATTCGQPWWWCRVAITARGQRTHEAIGPSELHVIAGAPHGGNVAHAEEFNQALRKFLAM